MNRDEFFIGFYWGPRKENVSACAGRLFDLFRRLQEVDPSCYWASVQQTRRSKASHPSKPQIAKALVAGVNRRHDNNEVIAELGFLATFISSDNLVLRVVCGGSSIGLKNCIVINFPDDEPILDRWLKVPKLLSLSKAIVEAWQPDSGGIRSHECSKIVYASPTEYKFGWINFFKTARLEAAPVVSKPSYVVQDEHGYYIILTDEPLSSKNTEHIELIRNVATRLSSQIKCS